MKKVHAENGAYLVLGAVIALGVIATFVFLVVHTTQARRISAELRRSLEEICEEVAFMPMLQSRGRRSFSKQLSNLNIPGAEIVSARLVIPTMSDDLRNWTAFEVTGEETSCGPHCDYIWSPVLQTDVGSDPLTYPTMFWKEPFDAGNTVACEVSARVNPFFEGALGFSEEKILRAKVSWSRIPENLDERFAFGSGPWRSAPFGLTVVVAPHMTTFAGYDRFLFAEQGAFGAGFRQDYDPLDNYSSTGVSGVLAFRDDSRFAEYPGLANVHPHPISDIASGKRFGWQSYFEYDRKEMLVACSNPAVMTRNVFLATILELAGRDMNFRDSTELLIAGTQHRLTRDMDGNGRPDQQQVPYFWNSPTQVIAKGQDLRQRRYQLPYITYWGGLRHSTESLLEPNVLFSAELLGRVNESSLDLSQGWIHPFAMENAFMGTWDPLYVRTGAGADPGVNDVDRVLNEVRSLISGQLRNCLHLFADYTTGTGVNLDPSIYIARNYNTENALFEWADTYVNNTKTIGIYPAAHDWWDSKCHNSADGPWRDPDSGCVEEADGLNATELVYSLGTIQQCPAEVGWADFSDLNTYLQGPGPGDAGQPAYCRKPPWPGAAGLAANDLRGDLVGALYYLENDALEVTSLGVAFQIPYIAETCVTPCDVDVLAGTLNALPAVRSPGLFPIRADYLFEEDRDDYPIINLGPGGEADPDQFPFQGQADPVLPFDIRSPREYVFADRDDSSVILIVTHQPITEEEVDFLEPRIAALSKPRVVNDVIVRPARPIIVAYFPVNAQDADLTVLERFQDALNIQNQPEDVNRLIVFSPYLEEYGTEYTGGSVEDDVHFKKFWNQMLSARADVMYGNVVDRAESVFLNFITKRERRL